MRTDIIEPGRAEHDSSDHASDADLIRLLDREAPLSPLHDITAHVGACAGCTTRLDLVRARRRRLASLLSSADVPIPAAPDASELIALAHARRRTRIRPALRAAALIIVVAGTLAAQPAVRRWVGAQWSRITGGEVQPALGAPSRAPAVEQQRAVAGSVLAFDAGAGPLAIRYDVRPTAGSLTVVADTGALVRAERVSGANLELLVSRQGLQVRNADGAAASFVVRIPRAIARVTLRFGTTSTPSDTTLDLARESRHVITFDHRVAPATLPRGNVPE